MRDIRSGLSPWMIHDVRPGLARHASDRAMPNCMDSARSSRVGWPAYLCTVIPGRAEREPGIHTHDRGYGFRLSPSGCPGMTAEIGLRDRPGHGAEVGEIPAAPGGCLEEGACIGLL